MRLFWVTYHKPTYVKCVSSKAINRVIQAGFVNTCCQNGKCQFYLVWFDLLKFSWIQCWCQVKGSTQGNLNLMPCLWNIFDLCLILVAICMVCMDNNLQLTSDWRVWTSSSLTYYPWDCCERQVSFQRNCSEMSTTTMRMLHRISALIMLMIVVHKVSDHYLLYE
jgi:hypothetical protein